MRIVGGRWRGREIVAPKGRTTRPTIDRVREALFSAIVARLGSDLGGGRVLDAFAGSGALGLEALSRGAASVTLVEQDRVALVALRRNVASLDAGASARVLVGDVFSLAEARFGGPFSLILLDPPYTLDHARVAALLRRLASVGAIESGALITWEHASDAPIEWPDTFSQEATKRYGSTEIAIAVYGEGEAE